MYLIEVRINKFKSFQSKQVVKIENGVTTLVGMNESGKTSFLHALAKSNYFNDDSDFQFDATSDYPRKELVKFNKSDNDPEVITCTYELDDVLTAKINDTLGSGVLNFTRFTISRTYKDSKRIYSGVQSNTKKFLENLSKKYSLNNELKKSYSKFNTLEEARDFLNSIKDESVKEIVGEISNVLANGLENWHDSLNAFIVKKYLSPNLPKFWYYDEYYNLPGKISLNDLRDNKLSSEKEKTAKALFELADISFDEMINANDYEKYIALLEASSNEITEQVFKYWSTNQNLDIEFKIETRTRPNPSHAGQPYIEKILDIRVKNQIHKITLPLDKRSKGFNWFFAFVIWFSKIQADKNSKYILLLDEPGLNLHASAQADLLKFIEDLSKNYQVIFTTHSPFMIDSDHLDRIRTVLETENGSVISDSIQEKDPNTLFPLQAALGYNIAQNLFISKNNLLVEGPADLLYLTFFSNILENMNRHSLNDSITIVPVGGLDKVSTFISLLRGSRLNIACILDTFTDQKGKQKVDDLIRDKIIKSKNIRFFDEFAPNLDIADIEDIFSIDEYVKIFNEAFKGLYSELNHEDFDGQKNIIPQINSKIGKERFNHYKPAYKLTQMAPPSDFFSDETLNKFENLFVEINKLF